tara:strand:+ start:607 stop:1233 length:627 start_codon:yes stop_codon:yes gene_type:complete
MKNSNLNLEEMVSMVEKLCKKGQAYRAKRMRAGEKSSAYLSGRAVKVCKGQMQGEGVDEDIEAEDDTEFKVSLKHLLKKHVSKGGELDEGELDEVEMTIQEVLNMDVIDEDITEAKYKGKTVTLNKPTRGDSKKFKVYVNTGKKNADGSIKVKKVNFGHGGTTAKKLGQKTMKIRKSNPKRRKAFRARHRCDNPGPKTMARYWSCKKW